MKQSNVQEVLLVDDDPIFLKLFSIYFKENFPNFNIIKTTSPIEALKIFRNKIKKKTPITFSVIDWKMPEITGEFLSVMFKKESDKIKTVLLTGSSDSVFLKHFSAYKFDLILSKRDKIEDIFEKLRNLIKVEDCCQK